MNKKVICVLLSFPILLVIEYGSVIPNFLFWLVCGVEPARHKRKRKSTCILNLTPGFDLVICFMFRDVEEAGEVSFYGQVIGEHFFLD